MNESLNLEENKEIEKALEEFEEKSNAEQKQPAPLISKNLETPKIVQWVIKISGGGIKNEKQAQYVLLGFVVIVVGISLFLFWGSDTTPIIPLANFENKPQFLP